MTAFNLNRFGRPGRVTLL